MKILLLGKNGQLGWELNKVLPALGTLVSLGRSELDLANPSEIIGSLMDFQPEVIINAAAYTEVDRAEIEPNAALQINAQAPGIMAEIARKLSAVMIHYSTDYVFDGKDNRPYTEDDRVNPLNAYGKSKYLGEENIKQAGDAYLIFRTSWVYSRLGNSFVNKVLGWSRKNTILKIVHDQISNPTWARMLAEISTSALIQNRSELLESIREIRGIYHLAGIGYTSRYEWARWILAHDPNQTEQLVQAIEPVSSDEFPTPAIRPSFSALDCSKFEGTFNIKIPGWQISLQEAMKG